MSVVKYIKSEDFYRAADIAASSLPCNGSMKEVVNSGGVAGKQNAYCIMGCLYQAIADRRKQAFGKVKEVLPDEVDLGTHIGNVLKMKGLDMVSLNDDVKVSEELCAVNFQTLSKDGKVYDHTGVKIDYNQFVTQYASKIKKARDWQVSTLNKYGDKLAKYEAKTGKFLDVTSDEE